MASAGRPRRVLIVVQNLPVPFDRRVWLEATTLTRAGYQVSVICPKAKGFTRSFEVLEELPYQEKQLKAAGHTTGALTHRTVSIMAEQLAASRRIMRMAVR